MRATAFFRMMQNPEENNVSSNTRSFMQLSLNKPLRANLSSLGYEEMTRIQAKSLPKLLNGEDVVAKASTGSGKTAAFGLTILNRLNLKFFAVQALVLCPTRELAEQVCQSIRQLARQMPNVKVINLSGGIPMRPQLDSLKHGAHIVVGTPGRIQNHLDKASLQLNQLAILTLDEADRMLDMGFLDAIRAIVKKCPNNRQTILFSATYPREIKRLTQEFMHYPTEISIEEADIEQTIAQQFYEVTPSKKWAVLLALIKHHKPSSCLIFCNTKISTAEVTLFLKNAGFSAIALNGDMEQMDRDLAIIQFTHQSCSILVPTDVAARGLDIKELPLVINYDVAHDPDVHTHRIGRTGRAGQRGLALTLSTPSDAQRICAIEDSLKKPVAWTSMSSIPIDNSPPYLPQKKTLCLDAGKKHKIRAGDILGALTKEGGLPSDVIGKIDIFALKSYVSIDESHVTKAFQHFLTKTLKGCRVNIKKVSS